MKLLLSLVAFAFGFYVPLTFGSEHTAPVVEVDLRFSPGPVGLPPANDMDGVLTEAINKDGFALFTQATQLPDSDFYTGYWLVVNKSPAGAEWPFNVQVYYNGFRGFLVLEPGKRSPIMRLVERSAWLAVTDRWQEVQLRDPVTDEMLGIFYLRLRANTDVTQSAPKPVILEPLSKTAE